VAIIALNIGFKKNSSSALKNMLPLLSFFPHLVKFEQYYGCMAFGLMAITNGPNLFWAV
jgi:hypothetical protein